MESRVLVLENYKDFRLRKQPRIVLAQEHPGFCVLHVHSDQTFHKTPNAAKKYFRNWHAIIGQPRCIWKELGIES